MKADTYTALRRGANGRCADVWVPEADLRRAGPGPWTDALRHSSRMPLSDRLARLAALALRLERLDSQEA